MNCGMWASNADISHRCLDPHFGRWSTAWLVWHSSILICAVGHRWYAHSHSGSSPYHLVTLTCGRVLNQKKKCTAVLIDTHTNKRANGLTTVVIFLSRGNGIKSSQIRRFSLNQKILSSRQISLAKNQKHEVLSCHNRFPCRSLLPSISC